MDPVERHQKTSDNKTLSQFEIEERVQNLLPSELVTDYKRNRRVPHIPEEQRLKNTPAREEKWSELAQHLAATLTGKNKQPEQMTPPPVTVTAEAIAAAVAEAMKAITAQQDSRAERIKQPDCFRGERSAAAVDGWLRAVERYTTYYHFTPTRACEFAVNLLRERADTWWRRMELKDNHPTTWESFKLALSGEFRPVYSLQTARDRLARLYQTGSVAEYIDAFQDIQLELPGMNGEEALDKFVRGLHPSVRGNVLAARPVDVDDACNIALAYASGLQIGRQDYYAPMPQPQQYQPQYQQPYQQQYAQYPGPEPMELDAINGRRNGYQPRQAPNRSTATCHWCGKTGHIKRNCRQRLAVIKQLDEEHRKKQDFRETQPINNEPIEQLNNKDTFDQYKNVINKKPKTITEEICDPCLTADQTFLEDLHAAVDTDLPLYAATLNGQQILVLIDSGASANYVSPQIVHLATHVTSIPGRSVETAGGHSIRINQKATLPLSLNGYADTVDAFVFPTKFDLILGRTWLQQAKPIPDWHHDHWILRKDGQEIVLRPHGTRPMKPHLAYLISAKQVQKLSRREEAECFLLHIKSPKETTNDEQWMKLVKEFDDVFQDGLPGLPPNRDVQHVINTGDAYPVNKPPFKMSPRELDELKKQLKELLDLGLIRPSSSPWGAPILFVKKKNGEMRMCVDYRALNKVTVRNNHPLPRIDECLERLHGANHFTSLDLRSGYHQVKIQESDVPKTAFNTRYGQYEFLVLPFGLTNAPPTFQHLMNKVLGDCLDKFALVYLDDILIFSKTPTEHEEHVRHVLNQLREAKLIANFKKCEFNKKELTFLGFNVSAQGILPSPDKVKTVQEWTPPTNVQEVRQFIGLAQHYRRFIPGFAGIASPLTDLTKGTGPKRRPVVWTDTCQTSFDILKDKLSSAPVLLAPNMDKPFRIETDASDFGVGAVLMQEDDEGIWKPLAFESKKLSNAERSYPAQERELLGILHALRTWRCMIEGKPFTVYTDHLPLKYFRSQVKPTPRLVRWIAEFELYDPIIQYKPGKENGVPDVLSRLDGPECDASLIESMEPEYLYIVPDSQTSDWPKFYARTESEWPEDIKDLLHRQRNKFVVHDQKVFRLVKIGDTVQEIRFALFAKRADLVNSFHNGFGHAGEVTVYDLMKKRWWWPGMRSQIQEWLGKCPQCQLASNAERNIHHAPMEPLDIPPAFSRWHLDFIGELPNTVNGNRWILVAVDYATNWPIARAVPAATGEAIANFLYEEIVMRFGCPNEILTDRGANFMSHILSFYIKKIKLHHKLTSAFHPRTNGKCERLNGILKQMLRKYVHGAINRWDEYLETALWACRIRKHRTTGFSPFFLTYGREPRLPGDPLRPFMDMSIPNDPTMISDGAIPFLRKLQQARIDADARVAANSQQDKERWDSIMKPHQFAIGEHLLLRHENKFGLEYNWMGPYIVVDKNFDKNIYKLTTMEGVPYTSWVHADRLKIAKSDDFKKTWYHPTPARAQMRRDLALDASSALPFSLVDSSVVDRGLSTVSGGGDVGHYFDESVKSEDD
ncbi:hypothetical protein INT47_000170 [Mucor saturninus]|uniref:RNA-directed DNA polymerase n=1 Tax=Mucor saturninus TaxID=64648 RepID=A0A8H7QE28_9FUNG|nr:hypothetical protein INT47_000170 [Mucor saturninus]